MRTAAVKHRSNIENIMQQFPITTEGKLSPIPPFVRPPWRSEENYENTKKERQLAYQKKHARVKQIKEAAHQQWTNLINTAPPSQLKRTLQRSGNQSGMKMYSKLSRNTCAKVIQLRTGHCHLNSYLYHFNLAESPLCECETGAETVEHFLLECPLYREQRRRLRAAAGSGNMRVDALLGTWEVVARCTEKFINETKRF